MAENFYEGWHEPVFEKIINGKPWRLKYESGYLVVQYCCESGVHWLQKVADGHLIDSLWGDPKTLFDQRDSLTWAGLSLIEDYLEPTMIEKVLADDVN